MLTNTSIYSPLESAIVHGRMSFGFSLSDFIALENLTFQLYKSIKDAPGKISRELGSFHIVVH
jgi:hypothetical protein